MNSIDSASMYRSNCWERGRNPKIDCVRRPARFIARRPGASLKLRRPKPPSKAYTADPSVVQVYQLLMAICCFEFAAIGDHNLPPINYRRWTGRLPGPFLASFRLRHAALLINSDWSPEETLLVLSNFLLAGRQRDVSLSSHGL